MSSIDPFQSHWIYVVFYSVLSTIHAILRRFWSFWFRNQPHDWITIHNQKNQNKDAVGLCICCSFLVNSRDSNGNASFQYHPWISGYGDGYWQVWTDHAGMPGRLKDWLSSQRPLAGYKSISCGKYMWNIHEADAELIWKGEMQPHIQSWMKRCQLKSVDIVHFVLPTPDYYPNLMANQNLLRGKQSEQVHQQFMRFKQSVLSLHQVSGQSSWITWCQMIINTIPVPPVHDANHHKIEWWTEEQQWLVEGLNQRLSEWLKTDDSDRDTKQSPSDVHLGVSMHSYEYTWRQDYFEMTPVPRSLWEANVYGYYWCMWGSRLKQERIRKRIIDAGRWGLTRKGWDKLEEDMCSAMKPILYRRGLEHVMQANK